MNLAPILLQPKFVHRIWGARTLARLYPEKEDLIEPIGEVWLTGNDCLIAGGDFAGRNLAEAWRTMPPEIAGTRVNTHHPFPLLVKFLFPEDILSIQVHPDDEFARTHEAATGWTGKTEMWHVIAAREGAVVLVGLEPGVTRESFRQAIADGITEKCLRRIPVSAGDTIFVPAGTVHTIGPGSVLCEIQEYSDLTYRVFDYNRTDASGKPRELHIEKALAVARFGEQLGGKTTPQRHEHPGSVETLCAECPYFSTSRWDFSVLKAEETRPEHFELLIILDGEGALSWADGRIEYSRAQLWLLPAALGAYALNPAKPTTLLQTFVPDTK
jgi:mannose-6-phosphate isomerase